MNHTALTKQELVEALDAIRASVDAGDSFEGSIEYLMPGPLGLEGDFAVRASYRVGNSMGQGAVVLIGADEMAKGGGSGGDPGGEPRYTTVRFKDEDDIDGQPFGPAVAYTRDAPDQPQDLGWIPRSEARKLAEDHGATFEES